MTARVRRLFEDTYGASPSVITSAPGRVNLIGEHTDYNGGEVLPLAIGQRTYVAMARRTGGGPSRAVTSAEGVPVPRGSFLVQEARPAGGWWDYVHGSLRALGVRGVEVPEVDCAVVSDVPVGAGLSSSAALEVSAVLGGVIVAGARVIDHWDAIASVAHAAETRFVGVACGIMDQTVSAFATQGYALHIRCDSGERDAVPWPDHLRVLIVDTATPRELRGSAFNERQAECRQALEVLRGKEPALASLAHAPLRVVETADLPDPLRQRARHVVSESARVGRFVGALATGALETLGALLDESHESLRVDFQCTSPELDWVVDWARGREGVVGARMTGAGWGGCAIVVGTEPGVASLAPELAAAFHRRFGHKPRLWLTGAEEGLDVEFSAD